MPASRVATTLGLLLCLSGCAGVSDRPLAEEASPALGSEASEAGARPHRSSPRALQESVYFRF